jgi:hypothetical protein
MDDLTVGVRLFEASSKAAKIEFRHHGEEAGVNPTKLLKAVGASIRLCGKAIIKADTTVTPPRNIRSLLKDAHGSKFALMSDKAFKAAYKALVAEIPDGATLVSVGSSPDKFAFMHECRGHKVVYLALSRAVFYQKSDAEAVAAVKAALKQHIALKPNMVFVDFADSGATIAYLRKAVPKSSKVIALTRQGAVFSGLGAVTTVAFPDEFWWHSKYMARCVPTNHGDRLQKPSALQAALCNLTRLWIKRLSAGSKNGAVAKN